MKYISARISVKRSIEISNYYLKKIQSFFILEISKKVKTTNNRENRPHIFPKAQIDLNQNEAKEKTPLLGFVFRALSHGDFRFVPTVSF